MIPRVILHDLWQALPVLLPGGVEAVAARMADLGFDPAVADTGDVVTVAFAHCPFRELAERRPDLICNLHRGLVEGLVDGVGNGAVAGFGTLVDRDPCRVDLRVGDEPVPVAGR